MQAFGTNDYRAKRVGLRGRSVLFPETAQGQDQYNEPVESSEP
jgi:hypothetical protein